MSKIQLTVFSGHSGLLVCIKSRGKEYFPVSTISLYGSSIVRFDKSTQEQKYKQYWFLVNMSFEE